MPRSNLLVPGCKAAFHQFTGGCCDHSALCKCHSISAQARVQLAPDSEPLPSSEDILIRLIVSWLPDETDPSFLRFLHALARMRYGDNQKDLGQLFYEYFYEDPHDGVIAKLLKSLDCSDDIVSESLESYYSGVIPNAKK